MPTYSDKDYFDSKFQTIDDRFETLELKIDKVYKAIYGNGQPGFSEKFRLMERNFKLLVSLVIGLIAMHSKDYAGNLSNFLKGILGL